MAATPLANASYARPRIEVEVQRAFELVYQARTLRPGGRFDVDALRGLVGGVYAEYTLPLLDDEVRAAQAGVLQQVTFKDIVVQLDEWVPFYDAQGNGTLEGGARVHVTRTREDVRAGASRTSETATYQFRMLRKRVGADSVGWVVTDFLNPGDDRWLSAPPPLTNAVIEGELKTFFDTFYEARTLAPGHPLDLEKSRFLVAGSFGAYTMPLLERSQAEAASGALREMRYTDISVRLESWDPQASDHGGLATVAVTRTALVARSSDAEPPQVATYEYRVHRHGFHGALIASSVFFMSGPLPVDWLAIDFLRPDVNRWVTDLAGSTVIIPDAAHY